MFLFLKKLFLDQTGEIAGPAAPAPEGSAPAPENTDAPAPEGQATEAPPAPKYGEFGDDADRVWEAFNQQKAQIDQYKGKTTATERNLAALRKTLDSSGIQVVSDDQGNIRLLPKDSQTNKQRRFLDEHKGLFDSKVLQAIDLRIQDFLDDALDGYTKKNQETTQQQRRFIAAKNDANELMMGYFPQLKAGAEGFNQSFYDRATEIWENEEAPDGIRYKSKAEGELLAALRAAKELGIPTQVITEAKKAGYEQGKAEKKILAPVASSSSGKAGGFRILDKDEYFKLSKDDRTAYDKKLIELRK